jgi:spermidine synthase
MRPFHTLASVTTPDGRRLTLHRRETDFFIHLDGEELMSSRAYGSEAALAELACRDLAQVRRPRVLIGGLGLGYTLRAALQVLPGTAEVIVAEVFPCVVDWNRRYLADLGGPLEDPRVRVVERDVVDLLGDTRQTPYQVILLDVDNGPAAWCQDSNRRLYDRRGLERIRRSLAPGGVLAVWSAQADPVFVKRLRQCGFAARAETARASGRKGSRHTIFLARVPPTGG